MHKKHPAKYSNGFAKVFATILLDYNITSVLDPMAGIGGIAEIRDYGYNGYIACNEIEPEWAWQIETNPLINSAYVNDVYVGDAANLFWIHNNEFQAVCTSPAYGNRMADKLSKNSKWKRISYADYLERDLSPNNGGKFQWGKKYKDKHIQIWTEMKRIASKIIIVNVSDHIRNKKIVHVTDWHIQTINSLGFNLAMHEKIPTRRMRKGTNSELRVDYESILVFEKSKNN